ncbi:MAG: class I SAM-dependent methyltransferase [Vicinamibacterales bacterium]
MGVTRARRASDRRAVENRIAACYSTWSRSYFRDYYGPAAPYPPVHRRIIRRLVREAGARRVLDAGCGPASVLRYLARDGADVYGFDLTEQMVDEARRVLARQDVPASHIWKGSVLSRASFAVPGRARQPRFDAAVCIGVLPHVPAGSDRRVLSNLRDAVRPGGLVAVEARNQLFAMYSLNRYSYDFFVNELLDPGLVARLGAPAERALRELKARFRMDLPPVRRGTARSPGYDEVLSRTHNPFELQALCRRLGLDDVRVHFYHYHCLPPMFEPFMPAAFRRESVAREHPDDWRGHFMASAFIVTGRRG